MESLQPQQTIFLEKFFLSDKATNRLLFFSSNLCIKFPLSFHRFMHVFNDLSAFKIIIKLPQIFDQKWSWYVTKSWYFKRVKNLGWGCRHFHGEKILLTLDRVKFRQLTSAIFWDEDQADKRQFSDLNFYKLYGIEIFTRGTSWQKMKTYIIPIRSPVWSVFYTLVCKLQKSLYFVTCKWHWLPIWTRGTS